jgi:hypothetical protein
MEDNPRARVMLLSNFAIAFVVQSTDKAIG